MKTLSLRQPWAWAIFHGKDIENRTWNTSHRGPFYVHAASMGDHFYYSAAVEWMMLRKVIKSRDDVPPLYLLERGGIIGSVELIGVIKPHSDEECAEKWHMHQQYGYILQNPSALPFTPMKGKLNFFEVSL